MTTPRRTGVTALALSLCLGLGGCLAPTPSSPPTPSATQAAVDLALPGEALKMVRELIAAAANPRLIQVEISAERAAISVVEDGKAATWAFRDGEIKQVDTDIAYVEQAIFNIEAFNINDVGGLFRAAAGMSGSRSSQELQIVDYSDGQVMMTVSTVPESRTVFFNPDGSLLPILDFHTEGGIGVGLADATGPLRTALVVGVQSNLGVYVEYPGSPTTTIRRLRTSQVPATTNERAETPSLDSFDPTDVTSAAIYRALAASQENRMVSTTLGWSVVIDRRDAGQPMMHFVADGRQFVTDLQGQLIPGR
ncbi:MAG: hypothetical protein WAS07_07035 [Micropruina sp.]